MKDKFEWKLIAISESHSSVSLFLHDELIYTVFFDSNFKNQQRQVSELDTVSVSHTSPFFKLLWLAVGRVDG